MHRILALSNCEMLLAQKNCERAVHRIGLAKRIILAWTAADEPRTALTRSPLGGIVDLEYGRQARARRSDRPDPSQLGAESNLLLMPDCLAIDWHQFCSGPLKSPARSALCNAYCSEVSQKHRCNQPCDRAQAICDLANLTKLTVTVNYDICTYD